jgi:hypothetical protein
MASTPISDLVATYDGLSPCDRYLVRPAMLERLRALGVDRPDELLPDPLRDGEPDERESIGITTNEAEVADQALAALARDTDVYTRGHPAHLVRVVRPRRATAVTGGAPVVAELSTAALRERLTRHVRFERARRDGQMRPAHPPEWCVAALAARGEYSDLRDLVGVVTTPTLRPDGTILDVPGYDDATGLLYVPTGDIPPVPASATPAEAQAARDELLEVVCDFPFAAPADRSAWLAMVLTLIARHAITGNVPLFDVDANVRGAGKGLLADTGAIIGTGHPLARKPQPSSDEEMRKYILAVALAGTPIVLLDNCTGKVSYRSLDAALTCEGRWEDRVLGKSESRTLPLRTIWCLTANNAALGHDLVRRTLPIRLRSELENPEDRDDIKHRDLLGWLRGERPRLVRAALTCLRAYYVAGCPERDLVPWGNYAAWSRLIRQAVVWLGLPDPITARHELRERADVDREAIVAVYDALERLGGATAAELRAAAEADADLRAALVELAGGDELPTTRRIGAALREMRDRVIGERQLERRTAHGGALRYGVRTLRRASDSHHSHHSHPVSDGDCGGTGDCARAAAGLDL